MTINDLKVKEIPDSPGVYFFLSAKREILYLGKATSLKNRTRSYFDGNLSEKRSALIEKMVQEARSLEFTETDSVLEALILESNLIRTHKPRYNTIGKDDKSYNHLIITKEEYPRVLVVRGKDITEKFARNEILYEFGPFPSSSLFKEALKIVSKLFQYYDTIKPLNAQKSKLEKGKINFNTQIGLYPSEISATEYNKTIRHIKLFFEGKKKQIVNELEREMRNLAKAERFEEASVIKKRIFALNHIQDISLIKKDLRSYQNDKTVRIEAFDVAHLFGGSMVGGMTVVENGLATKSEYRKFKIKSVSKSDDTKALREILTRRLTHSEWPRPTFIVVDGSIAQKNVAEAVIKEAKLAIPVVGVVKDKKHKPIRLIGSKELVGKHKDEILLANAEAHRFAIDFHRSDRRKQSLI